MFVDQEYNYYYGKQIKDYITQFAQVFSEMYVTIGKNDYNSDSNYVRVPVFYGAMDKVVAAIKSGNTQNSMVRIPCITVKLDNMQMDQSRMSGTNTTHRKTVLPVGGDIKTDLKVIKRLKPFPYDMTFTVTILASNSDQMFQLMEQIFLLFDPFLQIQKSDSYGDWTKIVDAELTSVDMNDNRNPETDGRILTTTCGFAVRVNMAPPADIRDEAIQRIRLRVQSVGGTDDVQEIVSDVGRPTTERYIEIYNVDEQNIPPN